MNLFIVLILPSSFILSILNHGSNFVFFFLLHLASMFSVNLIRLINKKKSKTLNILHSRRVLRLFYLLFLFTWSKGRLVLIWIFVETEIKRVFQILLILEYRHESLNLKTNSLVLINEKLSSLVLRNFISWRMMNTSHLFVPHQTL